MHDLVSQITLSLCAHTILQVSRLKLVKLASREYSLAVRHYPYLFMASPSCILLDTISYLTAGKCLAGRHQKFELQALKVDLCMCACCTSGRKRQYPLCDHYLPCRGAALGESHALDVSKLQSSRALPLSNHLI